MRVPHVNLSHRLGSPMFHPSYLAVVRRGLRATRGLTVCVMGLLAIPAAAQTVAFTFDDGFDPRTQPRAADWNRDILAALANAKVHAMLFPAGKNVDSPEGRALVVQWAEAGHPIGNHSYSHLDLCSPEVSLEDFQADVLREQALLGALSGWRKRLRFPYLKEGDTEDKRDGMRDWMHANGYLPGPVSIDASDWY